MREALLYVLKHTKEPLLTLEPDIFLAREMRECFRGLVITRGLSFSVNVITLVKA